jgi:hypothetical protein
MDLQYMLLDPDWEKHQAAEREAEEREMKADQQRRTKRRMLICLLLLMYLIVANTAYNLWVAKKGTPVWKFCVANVIQDLWATRKITVTKAGTVVGILYSKEKACALINHEVVCEGDITNGVKVVRIDKHKVEFEKDGERWTQKVLANPNSAWKTPKLPTG